MSRSTLAATLAVLARHAAVAAPVQAAVRSAVECLRCDRAVVVRFTAADTPVLVAQAAASPNTAELTADAIAVWFESPGDGQLSTEGVAAVPIPHLRSPSETTPWGAIAIQADEVDAGGGDTDGIATLERIALWVAAEVGRAGDSAAELQQQASLNAELTVANRFLQIMWAVNQVMVEEQDEAGMFAKLGEVLLGEGYCQVAIDLVGGDLHLRPFLREASPNLEAAFDLLDGLVASAWGTGNVQVWEAPADLGDLSDWERNAIEGGGIHAAIALPLRAGQQSLGVLALATSGTQALSDTELGALAELADNVARGILALRHQSVQLTVAEELYHREEILDKLAENNRQVYVLKSWKTQQLLYVSPAYQTIWGRSCSSLYQDPNSWIDAIYPDDRADVEAFLQELRDGGGMECRVLTPDGILRWLTLQTHLIHDRDDEIEEIAIVAEDISDRKHSEFLLHLTQIGLNNSQDSYYLLHQDGSFAYTNETAYTRLGYTQAELLGLNIYDVDPLYPPKAWQAFWNVLKSQGTMTIESLHRTKNSAEFPVEISANFVSYENKEFVCAIVRDITKQKQAEERRERMRISRSLVGKILRDFQARGALSEAAMFQAGFDLALFIAAPTLNEYLEAFTGTGLGTLTLVETKAGRLWRFVGNHLVEVTAGSEEPTCHYARGYLCGVVSQQLDDETLQVAGVEMHCQSLQDEYCMFIVQALG